MKKVLNLLNKVAPRPAGEVTHENEAKTAEEALATLSKEARKALRESVLWNQEFHGAEIVAVIAIFLATRQVLGQKEAALSKAIEFIGSLENHPEQGKAAIDALEQNGNTLRYVTDKTEKVCLAAVNQNGNALRYVRN